MDDAASHDLRRLRRVRFGTQHHIVGIDQRVAGQAQQHFMPRLPQQRRQYLARPAVIAVGQQAATPHPFDHRLFGQSGEQGEGVDDLQMLALDHGDTAQHAVHRHHVWHGGHLDDVQHRRHRIAGLAPIVAQAQRRNLVPVELRQAIGDRHQPPVQPHEGAAARSAEQVRVDILDPLDQRQFQQAPLARQFLEPQRSDHFDAGLRVRLLFLLPRRPIVDDVGQARRIGQARRVQQQHRLAIVGQGHAGIDACGHHQRRSGTDHQFLMIVDRRHAHGKGYAGRRAHHHDGARPLLHRLGHAQHILQIDHRMADRADRRDLCAAHFADMQRFIVIVQDFDHRRAGNGEMLPAGAHDQAGDDGQRQRHAQRDAQPLPRLIVERDDAADPLHIGPDHVHADAPAGNGRHLGGGRQAGVEDQVQPVLFGHARGRIGRQPPVSDRLVHQPRRVDTRAVIGDGDDDLVARLARFQPQPARFRLAGGAAFLRRLDTMVDAVAHDMGERVDDHLHHFAVHLDIAAFQAEVDALAQFPAQVAHHARDRGEQAIDTLHPRLGNHVAHIGNAGRQPLEHIVQFGVGRSLAQLARQFVAGQHHVRHAVHQLVDQAERQANGPRHRLRGGR
eukprot:Opistho-2@50673